MEKPIVLLLAAASAFCAGPAPAQSQSPSDSSDSTVQRDQQAILLLSQSLATITRGKGVEDIKIEAKVTRTAGSEVLTGSAVLEAGGYDKARIHLVLGPRAHLEIRNGPAGVWSGADAQNHPLALHNCWTGASWFAPAVVVQSWIQDSSFALAYVGSEILDGAKVEHLRSAYAAAGNAQFEALSATDLYLDSQSLVPVALTFQTHPDNDVGVSLPVRVTFGDYERTGAIVAPARIQYFLQNSLFLDLTVNATAANNGLPAGDFQVPALP